MTNKVWFYLLHALCDFANCTIPEQGRLFYLAYELVKVDEGKLEAHLWSYRPQINLEHLKSTVQAGSDYKILDTFLQAVSLHVPK